MRTTRPAYDGVYLAMLFFAAVGSGGCLARTIAPDATLIPAEKPVEMNYADYAVVLRRIVHADGIDYNALADDRQPLERFCARISVLGPRTAPELFPSREDRLAYAINAYNAGVVRAVLEAGEPNRVANRSSVDFDSWYRLRVDGQWRLLSDLRRTAMDEAENDWRVPLALCGGRRGDPPLAAQPYLPGILPYQLNEQVGAALAAPQIVTADHGLQRLRLGRVLFDMKDRLIRDYEGRTGARDATMLSVLLDVAPRQQHTALNATIGYRVVPLRFDGRLNMLATEPQERSGFDALVDWLFIP
jgi:hypothetical protein